MLPAVLIAAKREGRELDDHDIAEFIDGYVAGNVADYQMSAMAMAICLRGMTTRETATLTRVMLESGDRLPGQGTSLPRVDKHSTGGLGDKVSLILAPWLAACGVHVPMVSGRGLGLTGGTLDKLESIDGFEVNFANDQTPSLLQKAGSFIISASERIAPADRQLYALRDVTGTVESIPLITASILSKKLSASLDALVMDVKCGSAAFMKTPEDAGRLARSIIDVGNAAGLPTRAMITDMDQPLGWAVGNAIEVNESLEILDGDTTTTTHALTRSLCISLLVQSKHCRDEAEAKKMLDDRLGDGSAREHFERMVNAQGGRLDGPLSLERTHTIEATEAGNVADVDCQTIGTTLVGLGAGRRVKTDPIRHRVGLRMHVRVGDEVSVGQPLVTVYSDEADDAMIQALGQTIRLTTQNVTPRPLIMEHLA